MVEIIQKNIGLHQLTRGHACRPLGFVGDIMSITLRRGGLLPASRDPADQTP